jgi:hypothetical protein
LHTLLQLVGQRSTTLREHESIVNLNCQSKAVDCFSLLANTSRHPV